jgi:predicted dehydrogenase
MTYRALVVGLGQIGMGYDLDADPAVRIATLARAFSEHPGFELVGGVDFDVARRGIFNAHYDCPSFSNLERAIDETRANIIAIATPTESHYQVISQVLQFNTLKAILCEKPLSFDFSEAEAMVNLADKSQVPLFTNYMRRCDRAVIEVRRRIVANEISGRVKGTCWYTKGMFNNGSHFLNLFQYWLGEVRNFKVINQGRVWHEDDPEPDVKVEFESGDIYFLAAQAENFSHHIIELIAANGRLCYEQGSMRWQSTILDSSSPGYVVLNPTPEMIDSDVPRLQWCVADQMARYLAGEETSICTGSQGLATLNVLTQIRNTL